MGLDEEYQKSSGAKAELCDIVDETLKQKYGEDFDVSNKDKKCVKKIEKAIRESVSPLFLSGEIKVFIGEHYDKETDILTSKYRTVGFSTETDANNRATRLKGPVGEDFYIRTETEITGKLNGNERPSEYTKKYISEKVTEDGIVFSRTETVSEHSIEEKLWDEYAWEGSCDGPEYTVRTARVGRDIEHIGVQLSYKTQRNGSTLYENSFSLRNSENANIEDIQIPISNEQLKEMLISGEIAFHPIMKLEDLNKIQDKINALVPDVSKCTKNNPELKQLQRQATLNKVKNSKNEAVKAWAIQRGYCTKEEISRENEQSL